MTPRTTGSRRRPPERRRSPRRTAERTRAARAWFLAGVVALGLGVGWRLLSWAGDALTGDEPGTSMPAAGRSPTPDAAVEEVAAPTGGAYSAVFPRSARGTRLEVEVLSLGDDPERCRAVGLVVGGDLRTVYHHRCEGADPDSYFLLARLTNRSDAPARVELARFALGAADGSWLGPLVGEPGGRRFPASTVLGTGASLKGWVIFEVEDESRPTGLRYVDDGETLTVRLRGDWVGR